MASRNRRHSLFNRRALSCLAGPTLSQRDLARFRADRRKLPLFGGSACPGHKRQLNAATASLLRVSWDFNKSAYVLLMGFGRNDFILPAHRPAFARLWHDALPFKWSVPEWHVDP